MSVAATLMRMALALLDRSDRTIATIHLRRALDDLDRRDDERGD